MKYVLKQNKQYYHKEGVNIDGFLTVVFTTDVQQAKWFSDMVSAEAANARTGLRFAVSSVANELYSEEEQVNEDERIH